MLFYSCHFISVIIQYIFFNLLYVRVIIDHQGVCMHSLVLEEVYCTIQPGVYRNNLGYNFSIWFVALPGEGIKLSLSHRDTREWFIIFEPYKLNHHYSSTITINTLLFSSS